MEEVVKESMLNEENIDTLTEEMVKKVPYNEMPFHKRQEEIVDILCTKTGSEDRGFFRVMVAYKFAEMSSNMRASVEFISSKGIPTNMYALDLAPSGYSKNASMNILEKEIFSGFKKKFMDTMQIISEANLDTMAGELAIAYGTDVGDEKQKVMKEYGNLPKFLYSFGASTPEGFKAMRAKLSMAGIGATSNVIDEIGSNLTGNQETMVVQLEAYDTGDSKQKLIKTDGGNSDMRGSVPSNLFAFGTQSKLLDGCTVEKQFFELLETGYARRFVLGFVEKPNRDTSISAEDMFNMISSPTVDMEVIALNAYFEKLADKSKYGISLSMNKDTAIELIQYRLDCDKIANNLKEHEEILKAVIQHSYWRALKIAGAYAFADGRTTIEKEHIHNAIALCEEGIRCFRAMMKREKAYVRLAKYISEVGKKITQVDLVEDLVFYRGSETQKRELMTLATAYGYNNNIIIKKTIKDGIEFLEGEKLEETDLNSIMVSYSKDIAYDYKPTKGKWVDLHRLVDATGYHYCSHSFIDGHRKGENAIKGFNLLILDIDKGVPLDVAKTLLKDYTFLISTTKRHTESNHRYRILLPMSHRLDLSQEDYKKFMTNVFNWLPFDNDEQTSDIARKWESFKGEHWYNDGKLIDALQFIPDTPKESAYKELYNKYSGTEKLQRWFLMNFREEDGRNNMLLKYALALLDNGMNSDNIRHSVHSLNEALKEPLANTEIESTVMKTVLRKEFEKEK